MVIFDMYRIAFENSTKLKKDFVHLKRSGYDKMIRKRLENFQIDPSRYRYKKLKSPKEGAHFRLRHGSFRILFDIDFANKVIFIFRIKQRKEGYK
jgi:mRNA-degrading endonuclease RelE of RelBE toxin-antitoxin system